MRYKQRNSHPLYWPAFVDILMLLVIILMSIMALTPKPAPTPLPLTDPKLGQAQPSDEKPPTVASHSLEITNEDTFRHDLLGAREKCLLKLLPHHQKNVKECAFSGPSTPLERRAGNSRLPPCDEEFLKTAFRDDSILDPERLTRQTKLIVRLQLRPFLWRDAEPPDLREFMKKAESKLQSETKWKMAGPAELIPWLQDSQLRNDQLNELHLVFEFTLADEAKVKGLWGSGKPRGDDDLKARALLAEAASCQFDTNLSETEPRRNSER